MLVECTLSFKLYNTLELELGFAAPLACGV